MLPRKLSRTELLLVVTAVGLLVLVLAIPRYALVDIMVRVFALDLTLSSALFALVMLMAIAAVAVAYGLGLESSPGQYGWLYDLYRHRRRHSGRRYR